MPDSSSAAPASGIAAQIVALGLAGDLMVRRPVTIIDLASATAPVRPRRPCRRRAPKGMPVLIATASQSGRSIEAWCPYCRKHHIHGRHGSCEPGTCGCKLHADLNGWHACTCQAGSGDGHRLAHCGPESPFKRGGGYWVREMPLSKLLWPAGPVPYGGQPPPPLAAELGAAGLSTAQARRLWATAVEAARRLEREARP